MTLPRLSGLLALVALGLAVALPAIAAVNLVVVDARGVTLTPGQVIDGTVPMTLKDGQQVSLIAPSGQLIKLRGPIDNKPALGDQVALTADVGAAMKALLTQKIGRDDRAGVVRGAAPLPIPPEPWLIDVTHPGIRCVPFGTAITFWRPQAGAQTTVVVAPSDRSWRATAAWQAGVDRMPLPDSIPVRQRATYVVKVGDQEVTLTLIGVPAGLENDIMRAAWMIEEGCDRQAQALLNTSGAK